MNGEAKQGVPHRTISKGDFLDSRRINIEIRNSRSGEKHEIIDIF
jgi:hypothetical protein